MKNWIAMIILLLIGVKSACAQTVLGPGEQPQLTVDVKGVTRIVYGDKSGIYYSISNDRGHTFSKPVLIAEVPDMHLGMSRGPQIASSKDYSLVTAMDRDGNIHAFRLTHKSDKWEKLSDVNDARGSAPEGLMSVAADDKNNFYAVWLDLREARKNNICFSVLKGEKWTTNRFVYKSPESHVCECCKPSIEVRDNIVSIMFRNWLNGSRDLYLITSQDAGQTFTTATKLGVGTWPLKGCPMDGGGLSIDTSNAVHTAWQRDGVVFYAQPGKPEERIGAGRHVGLSGNIIHWEQGSDLIIKRIGDAEQKIAEGIALQIFQFRDKSILAVWENSGQILFKTITG